MRYVRVRTEQGHEISTPEHDPLIEKGVLKVVDRKATTAHPLPPKFKTVVTPKGDATKKEG